MPIFNKLISLAMATLLLTMPVMTRIGSASTQASESPQENVPDPFAGLIPTDKEAAICNSSESCAKILADYNKQDLSFRTQDLMIKALPAILNDSSSSPEIKEAAAAVLKMNDAVKNASESDFVQQKLQEKLQQLDVLKVLDSLKDITPASDTALSTKSLGLMELARDLPSEQRSALVKLAWDQIGTDTTALMINVLQHLTQEQLSALDIENLESNVSTIIQSLFGSNDANTGPLSRNLTHDSLAKGLMAAADLLSALVERPAFAQVKNIGSPRDISLRVSVDTATPQPTTPSNNSLSTTQKVLLAVVGVLIVAVVIAVAVNPAAVAGLFVGSSQVAQAAAAAGTTTTAVIARLGGQKAGEFVVAAKDALARQIRDLGRRHQRARNDPSNTRFGPPSFPKQPSSPSNPIPLQPSQPPPSPQEAREIIERVEKASAGTKPGDTIAFSPPKTPSTTPRSPAPRVTPSGGEGARPANPGEVLLNKGGDRLGDRVILRPLGSGRGIPVPRSGASGTGGSSGSGSGGFGSNRSAASSSAGQSSNGAGGRPLAGSGPTEDQAPPSTKQTSTLDKTTPVAPGPEVGLGVSALPSPGGFHAQAAAGVTPDAGQPVESQGVRHVVTGNETGGVEIRDFDSNGNQVGPTIVVVADDKSPTGFRATADGGKTSFDFNPSVDFNKPTTALAAQGQLANEISGSPTPSTDTTATNEHETIHQQDTANANNANQQQSSDTETASNQTAPSSGECASGNCGGTPPETTGREDPNASPILHSNIQHPPIRDPRAPVSDNATPTDADTGQASALSKRLGIISRVPGGINPVSNVSSGATQPASGMATPNPEGTVTPHPGVAPVSNGTSTPSKGFVDDTSGVGPRPAPNLIDLQKQAQRGAASSTQTR